MARILIVDDAIVVRMVLRQCFLQLKHEVVGEAVDAANAMRLFSAHHPNLVILDLGLPDRPGLEIIQEMKHIAPDCRIIVYSAIRLQETILAAQAAGADAFLVKPITPAKLVATLQQVLEAG